MLVSEDLLFEAAHGLKNPYSKKFLSFLLSQNPPDEMSRQASSFLFAVVPDSISRLRGCKAGSTTTSWHTSDIRQAVKSLTSLCRIMGKPPFGQEMECP